MFPATNARWRAVFSATTGEPIGQYSATKLVSHILFKQTQEFSAKVNF
jgi:hypothetical protein